MPSANNSRAPNVIEQVWSMISELGFSKTIFESHISKIEKSLEADLKKYHDTVVNSEIFKCELQTLQLKFAELTRTRTKLERDVERKSEDYNHVFEQLNQSLIQKKELELKNQSVISSETKEVLEMEIIQLTQNFQESTEKHKILNKKLTDSLNQITFLESENKRLIQNVESIKIARKLSDDIFTKANTLGTGKFDTSYRPGIGRETFEKELENQENMIICENSESTLPDLFTSVNEEDSDDETVINCSPDDTDFNVSKSNSASSSNQQIKNTNEAIKTPLNKPKVFKNKQKKPLQPKVIPHKQVLNAGEPYDDTWYIDNGYSKHMTGNQSFLQDFKPTVPLMQKIHNQIKKMQIKSRGNHQH
ncbi:hypothetical protein L2E82_00926 [Cichorium intybus]|uniref:Uncharacterized protein n=1 Tax=Cichorium intybus TaxID=13427 RepID=A0ACB9GYZ3_CICIN|nr:hypothetical protein L2E82_00926 [Cichorium intybus]